VSRKFAGARSSGNIDLTLTICDNPPIIACSGNRIWILNDLLPAVEFMAITVWPSLKKEC
jgi:hypothetical protein